MKTDSKNWRERFLRELENELRGNAEWTQILRGDGDENLDAGTLARREFAGLARMIAEEFCEILADVASGSAFVSREGPSPEGKSQKAICPSRATKNNLKNFSKNQEFSHEGLFALSDTERSDTFNPSGLGPSCEKKADDETELNPEIPRFFILIFRLAKTILTQRGDCVLLDNQADCTLIREVKKCVPAMPIILDESLGGVPALFFERQFFEEQKIAEFLTAFPPKSPKKISEIQQKMIDGNASGIALSSEQKSAIQAILQSRITIVRGGPGTGKTTILFRALACLLAENSTLRIALAAPTNKAAARIREALNEQVKSSAGTNSSPEILEKIAAISPQTVHKLIGFSPQKNWKPLADFDVIVVDEFSMVSQDLFARLIDSLKLAGTEILAGTRLILLGDENQLEAVQGGRVLAELAAVAGTRERENALRERGIALPILRESRRFSNEKFVGKLAGTVLRGDVAGTQNLLAGTPKNYHADLLESNDSRDLEFLEMRTSLDVSQSVWQKKSVSAKKISEILRKILPAELQNPAGKSPAELLAIAEDFRIITPQHKGDFGDENLNAICATICGNGGNGFSRERTFAGTEFFHGQMILLTENDSANRLEKGEIGVICDDGNGEFSAYFRGIAGRDSDSAFVSREGPSPEGKSQKAICPSREPKNNLNKKENFSHEGLFAFSDTERSDTFNPSGLGPSCEKKSEAKIVPASEKSLPVRKVKISLLPAWQLGYAMTIHKSQGSEFSRLAVMIPPRANANLLSRALLYTALTRFKERGNSEFSLIFGKESLLACVANARESVSCLSRRIARKL